MAALTLDRVWVNRLDSGEAVSAGSWDRSQNYEKPGEVRNYAGGRQRAISTPGERGTFAFTLRKVPLPAVNTLRAWKGLPVQVRDHRGQRWFGVFFSVGVMEPLVPPGPVTGYWYDVALTLRTITAVEGV